MPLKGAGVKRGDWFHAVEAELRSLGFQRGGDPSGCLSAPGRYFYSRSGYTVQIAHGQTLRIFRPGGRNTEHHVPQMHDVMLVLGALDLDIQFPD